MDTLLYYGGFTVGRKTTISLGDTFGKLTVTGILPTTAGKHAKVEVVCSCGVEKTVQSHLLKSKIRSCGCSQYEYTKPRVSKPKLAIGESAFNALYSSYRLAAKRRNLAFELEKSEFKELTSQRCYYCGIDPHKMHKNGKSTYVYNGIDRVDNSQGYIEGNVRTACFVCNQAKHGMSEQDFMIWLKRLVDKWK
jgi:hypothetical protein